MAALMRNVGSRDRVVRIVAGVALIVFALYGPVDIAWKWIGWIGIVPLAIALVSWCPLYSLLGIKT